MSRHFKDRRIRSRGLKRRRRRKEREHDPLEAAYRPNNPRKNRWGLHELLNFGERRLFSGAPPSPPPPPRFQNTRDVLSYGVQLGVGKATQGFALERLKERFPQHAALLNDPMFVAGLKMALPLAGIQFAEHIRDPHIAARVRDVSQGMLLVNTIDTTADVTQHLAEELVGFARILLTLYGVDRDEADSSARQLTRDLSGDGWIKQAVDAISPETNKPEG